MTRKTRRVKVVVWCGLALAAASVVGLLQIARPDRRVAVEARVDPTLDSTDAVHPMTQWKTGSKLFVMSKRQLGGWILFAAHRDAGQQRVERVDVRVDLGQPNVHAEAGARWYIDSCPQLDEYATDIRGLVTVDAARMPTPGDDRIITYSLDGLRSGKPVHFGGKIIAAAGELDLVQMLQ